MRFRALPLLLFASVTTLLAQTQQTNRAVDGKAGTAAAPAAGQPDANGVDTIISLVKANVSEALVLKTIQRQNKAYDLTPQDLVKLQQAGVSETIINAMLDPSSATAAKPAPTAAPAVPVAAPAPPAAAPAAPVAPAAPRTAAAPAASAYCFQEPFGRARRGMSSAVFDSGARCEPTGSEGRHVLLLQKQAENERRENRGRAGRYPKLRRRQGRAGFPNSGQLGARQCGRRTGTES